jgi:beta-barrel assembly-enhancing protease
MMNAMNALRPLLFAVIAAATCTQLIAKDFDLPDFGRSANAGISERDEYYYGLSVLRELRNAGVLIEDPQVDEYFRTLGTRLVEAGNAPDQNFTYVLLNNDEFNAFAVPGGLIAVHTGLLMKADTESELAAVLAHENAHVTQKHTVRAIERARKASLPVLLGTLAMVAAASAANSGPQYGPRRNPETIDPVQAALISGSALMQQLQINFTRDNEFEADRIGIQTLKKAGFDVTAMAGMFGRMQSTFRSSGGAQAPQYLQTHPISVTRIAEAKSRAEHLLDKPVVQHDLPFQLIRERVRVLKSSDPSLLKRYYTDQIAARNGVASPALNYGYALASARSGDISGARRLSTLIPAVPELKLTRALLAAEISVAAKNPREWRQQFAVLLKLYPKHRVVGASYVQALLDLGTKADGLVALEVARELVSFFDSDPALFAQLGRAYELSGDDIRAGEAYARATALRGALEDALAQLQTISQGINLSYYERARLDAQIAELTPIVLEIRRREGTVNRQQLGVEAALHAH